MEDSTGASGDGSDFSAAGLEVSSASDSEEIDGESDSLGFSGRGDSVRAGLPVKSSAFSSLSAFLVDGLSLPRGVLADDLGVFGLWREIDGWSNIKLV